MQFIDHRSHLHIEVETKECNIPADERTRMQDYINQVADAVSGFAHSDLRLTVIRHSRNDDFHVEAKLKVPGQTIQVDERNEHLDSAFQYCFDKLLEKISAYTANPDGRAVHAAEQQASLQRDIIAPVDPDAGLVGQAAQDGDYRAFHRQLAGHEEWLRRRVGRWVQRYDEAEERIGGGLKIGDIVEQVFLTAFERYNQRPKLKPLHVWLEELIDPALKELMRHPAETRENASMARTLRDTPLPGSSDNGKTAGTR